MGIVNVSRRAVLAAMASLALTGCGGSKKADGSDDSKKNKDSEKSEDEAFSFGGIGDTSSSDPPGGFRSMASTRGSPRTRAARNTGSSLSA